MIHDCFIYNGEETILDIRLNSLSEHVDRFVIVEATETFAGAAKPKTLSLDNPIVAPFRDRITYHRIEGLPPTPNPWLRETYQRNQMQAALGDVDPDDIVFLSDADEIPDVPSVLKNEIDQPCGLQQNFYYYYLNLLTGRWTFACVARARHLVISPQEIRFLRNKPMLPYGGWHFSYLGDIDFIVDKLNAFSHQEFNKPPYNDPEYIRQAITERRSIFRDEPPYTTHPIEGVLPNYIVENKARFAEFIL